VVVVAAEVAVVVAVSVVVAFVAHFHYPIWIKKKK